MTINPPWNNLLADVTDRLRLFDSLVSHETASYKGVGGTIHCAKGCSGCCTLAVNCTAPEALLIAQSLAKPQLTALCGYIERLNAKLPFARDLKSYLRIHRKELGGCPFLENSICSIYEKRPLSCRSLLSTKESCWCSTDFSELGSAEKQAFVESLDRGHVAFPMHYLAATQNIGQDMENQLAMLMLQSCHLSIYGSMPVLVYLFCQSGLLESIGRGAESVHDTIAAAGLDSPFALQVESL